MTTCNSVQRKREDRRHKLFIPLWLLRQPLPLSANQKLAFQPSIHVRRHLEFTAAVCEVSLKGNKTPSVTPLVRREIMNGSRNKPSKTVSKGQTDADIGLETNHRDRKTGGGMLKKLKSRRSQTEKWPAVTEEELRALGRDISPDHVLGLRAVTEGIWCAPFKPFYKGRKSPSAERKLGIRC